MVEQLGADTLVHLAHGNDAVICAARPGRARRGRIGHAPVRRSRARVPVRHRHRSAPAMTALPALAVSATVRAPRRRQARAREHAHRHARRACARLSMVEFDVKLAADNVAFLLHDATLDRTTSGRGRADALPWRELSRLDAGGWHSREVRGRDAAHVRRDRPLGARAWRRSATSRSSPRRGASARRAPPSRSTRLRYGAMPTCRRSCRRSRKARSRRRATRSRRFRARCCSTSCPATGSIASRAFNASRSTPITSALTRDVVARRTAAGSACAATPPNDPARVRELGEWGVDTIITDAVDAIPADSVQPAGSRT